MKPRRAAGWLGVIAILELLARAIVYGLSPSASESSRALAGHLGGPGFAATLVVAVGLGALGAVVLVWLASLGVRERWALADDRPPGGPPRIAARLLLGRAAVLTLAGWVTFAAIEATIHLEQGLGFHGLECLVGPVHRNALPVIGGLALLVSALRSVAALVLAWMRRTMGRLVAPRAVARPRLGVTGLFLLSIPRPAPLLGGTPTRGPPLPVV